MNETAVSHNKQAASIRCEAQHGIRVGCHVLHPEPADMHVDPYFVRIDRDVPRDLDTSVVGPCDGKRRSPVERGALDDRRGRRARDAPPVLPREVSGGHAGALESLEPEEGRRRAGSERIRPPRDLESVGDSISVGVREQRRRAVHARLHRVGKSVSVRVARRVRDGVEPGAAVLREKVRPLRDGRMRRRARDVEPRGVSRRRSVRRLSRVDVVGMSARCDCERERVLRLVGGKRREARQGMRGRVREASEQREAERSERRAHKPQRVAGRDLHERGKTGRGVDPRGCGPHGVRRTALRAEGGERVGEFAAVPFERAGEESGGARLLHRRERHHDLGESVRPRVHALHPDDVVREGCG